MMVLFKSISRGELKNVVKNTWEHARNLGLFVLGYKAGCLALEKLWGHHAVNNFLCGFVLGGLVFGRKRPVLRNPRRSMCRLCCTCWAESCWAWFPWSISNCARSAGTVRTSPLSESTGTYSWRLVVGGL
jgi:hypothetical protein